MCDWLLLKCVLTVIQDPWAGTMRSLSAPQQRTFHCHVCELQPPLKGGLILAQSTNALQDRDTARLEAAQLPTRLVAPPWGRPIGGFCTGVWNDGAAAAWAVFSGLAVEAGSD